MKRLRSFASHPRLSLTPRLCGMISSTCLLAALMASSIFPLFQRYMAHLFRDMPFVFPYIDNIAFASSTWEEHERHALAIVHRLNSVNLKIKPSSVNLGNHEIKLLGHIINKSGIGIDPEKRDMILQWPRPLTGTELASALGLGSFLRDHIRGYADITAPLERVKRQKDIDWASDPTLDQSWQAFKRAFSIAPILRFPDLNKRICVARDAHRRVLAAYYISLTMMMTLLLRTTSLAFIRNS